jgi:two-component system chemotaxis sensor kinase CheA
MQLPNPAQTYLVEAADLLDQVEEIVLEINQRPTDREAVNRLFRAFHTIKGSGAMFGFDGVASFTHHVETALDELRKGTIAVTPPLVALVLAARDHIQQMLGAGAGDPVGFRPRSDQLAAELRTLVPAAAAAPAATVPDSRPVSGKPPVAQVREPGARRLYRIRFKPAENLAATGLDPASLLNELRGLGSCRLAADLSGVPALGPLDPTKCHLAWNIELTTERDLNAVRDVFIFAEDGSELCIEEAPIPVDAAGGNGDAAPRSKPASAATVTAFARGQEPVAARPVAADAGGANSVKALRDAVVRVPSAKLDHIVSLIGELVMNESRLSQVSARLNSAELGAPVEAIERLIAELRDAVLGIRMMPIGSTFSRFKRLVHDLSHDLGKEVDLVTEGAETELDKTVLDQLSDPLVHLIRNSIDHGIGTPAERVAMGKPPRGMVRLSASHEGSHVVVTVQDDGRGLDAEKIRAKAIEQKLISPDSVLSEAETFNLIFLPGFSTAAKVTEVSGRGVGMDVVRKQIDALRGAIQLTSRKGEGTTLSLALPLTLAIIEGLLVTVAGDPFIIPMSVVMENVELRRSERTRNNGRNLVNVRGELVPYLHLRELFKVPGEEPEIEKIVIARFGRNRVGLVVDKVLGTHQTVIQSLGRMFKDLSVVSGGTILGDGRVALILDLSGVVACAEKSIGGLDAKRPVFASVN